MEKSLYSSLIIVFLTVSVISAFSSCTKNHNDASIEFGLVSKWKLIEQKINRGDGSGAFAPVSINKIVTFYSDSTVTSNGSLCHPGLEGTLKETTYTKSEIICLNRVNPRFLLVDSQLIINFTCFEGCSEKYEKIK